MQMSEITNALYLSLRSRIVARYFTQAFASSWWCTYFFFQNKFLWMQPAPFCDWNWTVNICKEKEKIWTNLDWMNLRCISVQRKQTKKLALVCCNFHFLKDHFRFPRPLLTTRVPHAKSLTKFQQARILLGIFQESLGKFPEWFFEIVWLPVWDDKNVFDQHHSPSIDLYLFQWTYNLGDSLYEGRQNTFNLAKIGIHDGQAMTFLFHCFLPRKPSDVLRLATTLTWILESNVWIRMKLQLED